MKIQHFEKLPKVPHSLVCQLTREEAIYLQERLLEPLEYFRMLAGNSQASAKSRQMYQFMDALWRKLDVTQSESGSQDG